MATGRTNDDANEPDRREATGRSVSRRHALAGGIGVTAAWVTPVVLVREVAAAASGSGPASVRVVASPQCEFLNISMNPTQAGQAGPFYQSPGQSGVATFTGLDAGIPYFVDNFFPVCNTPTVTFAPGDNPDIVLTCDCDLEFLIEIVDCDGNPVTDPVTVTHQPGGDTFIVAGGSVIYSPPVLVTGNEFFADGYVAQQPDPGIFQSGSPIPVRFVPNSCSATIEGTVTDCDTGDPPVYDVTISYTSEFESGTATATGGTGAYTIALTTFTSPAVVSLSADAGFTTNTSMPVLVAQGATATVDFDNCP